MRLFQSKEKKQEINAARSAYIDFARDAASSDPKRALALAGAFKEESKLGSLSEKERRELGGEALRAYAENVLADDCLTSEEEEAFNEVVDALSIDPEEFHSTFADLRNRVVVARVNDGRLATIDDPRLMTKKGEVVHLEALASLMKEVAVREWQGGSSGVSFRIAKGVSYRTGGVRGKSVVVGTELQVADSGSLHVTSHRVVYMGNKTIELPYTKLINLDVFSDGVRFHASNRQNAPLLQVESGLGEVIAATVNAAMQNVES
jgi:hypothetical protein